MLDDSPILIRVIRFISFSYLGPLGGRFNLNLELNFELEIIFLPRKVSKIHFKAELSSRGIRFGVKSTLEGFKGL